METALVYTVLGVVVKPGMMEMETEMEMEMETEILACVINVCSQTSTPLPRHWTGFLDLTTDSPKLF